MRVNPKLGLDWGSFRPLGRKSQLEISTKEGASSSIVLKFLKFKLKGGKGSKLSQEPSHPPVQAKEPHEEESREEPKEDEEEEGEVMIICPP